MDKEHPYWRWAELINGRMAMVGIVQLFYPNYLLTIFFSDYIIKNLLINQMYQGIFIGILGAYVLLSGSICTFVYS